ncbi:carbamoyltransferase N-terminal domain-containing protein [Bradyrhizobium sp. 87]|uniref:carbamoyltransferase N-terminal domain-containing protein n=1 Tax=Bradyrhizobium sp. 87 TaxID=2782682 RepID=UPI001FF8BC94|nr:carbamoyltransferase N-terminal domain-containing protein [Bradyrhizobium sp. 87]
MTERSLSCRATPITLKGAPYDGRLILNSSYPHVTGHLASAYCTSPFTSAEQSCSETELWTTQN